MPQIIWSGNLNWNICFNLESPARIKSLCQIGLTNLKQLLSKMSFIKFSKLSERQLAKVRKKYSPFLLYFILHVDHLQSLLICKNEAWLFFSFIFSCILHHHFNLKKKSQLEPRLFLKSHSLLLILLWLKTKGLIKCP